MIQMFEFNQIMGVILIIMGIIFVVYGLKSLVQKNFSEIIGHRSKGFILVGPIPIVWGYGWKGYAAALLIGAILLALFIIF